MAVQSSKWEGLTYYDRSVWLPPGVAESPGGTKQTVKPGSTLFVHYSAFGGMNVDTLAEMVNTMRAIRHHHVNVNGWADIGYSWVVFQPYGSIKLARVFRGRGNRRIPASQEGHNTGNLSVCVVTLDEQIKESTVSRIKSIYKRVPCTNVRGHRDVNQTACPGNKLYGRLPEIRAAKS
jgi:hypothetical protein